MPSLVAPRDRSCPYSASPVVTGHPEELHQQEQFRVLVYRAMYFVLFVRVSKPPYTRPSINQRATYLLSNTNVLSQHLISCLRRVCAHLEQHIGEVTIGELEVPLVVELQQRRAIRMLLLQMKIMHLRLVRRVSAFFTDVHLSNRHIACG